MRSIQQRSFFKPDGTTEIVEIELEVKETELITQLGRRAYANKSGTAKLAAGRVVAKIVRRRG